MNNPVDFVVRAATLDDLEPVLQLMVAQNIEDFGEPSMNASYLRDSWSAPGFDLTSDSWITRSPDDQCVAYAEIRSNRQEGSVHLGLFIAPQFRQGETGFELIKLAEKRACTNLSGSTSIRLITRVGEGNTHGKRLLERAGFRISLTFNIMEILFSSRPARATWPEGVAVRAFAPGQDEQATYLADEEASRDKGYYKPMTFAEWSVRMGLQREAFDPSLWLLACAGDYIAGVALNNYSPRTDTGWVDHLGVRRKWRNQGIGMALLLHSFGEFQRRGINHVKLSVDSQSLTNAPRLYQRAGLNTLSRYHVFAKTLSSILPAPGA